MQDFHPSLAWKFPIHSQQVFTCRVRCSCESLVSFGVNRYWVYMQKLNLRIKCLYVTSTTYNGYFYNTLTCHLMHFSRVSRCFHKIATQWNHFIFFFVSSQILWTEHWNENKNGTQFNGRQCEKNWNAIISLSYLPIR